MREDVTVSCVMRSGHRVVETRQHGTYNRLDISDILLMYLKTEKRKDVFRICLSTGSANKLMYRINVRFYMLDVVEISITFMLLLMVIYM